MEIDQDKLRRGTAIGSCMSREHYLLLFVLQAVGEEYNIIRSRNICCSRGGEC